MADVSEAAKNNAARTGGQTTEYAEAQNSGKWAVIGMVLGVVITLGSTIATSLGADTNVGIIAGAVVTILAVIQRTLVSLGYIKSRTAVKTSTLSR